MILRVNGGGRIGMPKWFQQSETSIQLTAFAAEEAGDPGVGHCGAPEGPGVPEGVPWGEPAAAAAAAAAANDNADAVVGEGIIWQPWAANCC